MKTSTISWVASYAGSKIFTVECIKTSHSAVKMVDLSTFESFSKFTKLFSRFQLAFISTTFHALLFTSCFSNFFFFFNLNKRKIVSMPFHYLNIHIFWIAQWTSKETWRNKQKKKQANGWKIELVDKWKGSSSNMILWPFLRQLEYFISNKFLTCFLFVCPTTLEH